MPTVLRNVGKLILKSKKILKGMRNHIPKERSKRFILNEGFLKGSVMVFNI